TADDAGVYKLTDEIALVQTADFFTPIVDDPYTFGRIAAATSLSDIYAMGGRQLTTLSIACYPDQLDPEGLGLTLRGAPEHAAADIAGFGFIGHAWEMAHGSKVNIRVHAAQVPVFEEALVFAKRGYLTQGDVSNREYTRGAVTLDKGVSSEMVQVLFDPQTSGGLLIALPSSQASALVDALHARGVGSAVIIGEVEAGDGTIT